MITLYRFPLLASGVLAGSALLAIAASPQSQGSAPAQKSAGPAKASPAGSRAGGAAAFPAKPAEGRGATSTLTIPATPAKAPDAQGFIPRWLVLEPIPVSSDLTENVVRTEVMKEYFPNQLTIFPKDDEKVTVNGQELTWHAVDTKLYNVNLYHFGWSLNKPTSNVLFWVVTTVNCPREMHDVRLAIGSNAASIWWVNGQESIGIYGDRQTVIDDGVSRRITLNKGPNVVRAAVVNGGGATDFCARFLDANDKPVAGFTVSLSAPSK